MHPELPLAPKLPVVGSAPPSNDAPALRVDVAAPREADPVSPALLRRARVVAEVLFETESGPPDEERLAWVERDLASFLGHSGLQARLLIGACLFFLSAIGPLLLGKLGSLGSLSLADRRLVLARVEKSPFAATFLGAKAILCMVYYEHPDAAKDIGYDALCMKRRA